MRIRLREIDTRLARTLSELLWEWWKKNVGILARGTLLITVAFLLLGIILAPLLGPGPSFLGALAASGGFVVYWGSMAVRARPGPSRLLSAGEIRTVTGSLSLTGTERQYVGALCELLAAAPSLGEGKARDLLPSLNELIQNDRQLESQRRHVERATGGRSMAELEAERAGLSERAADATDPVARQAMRQSLALCEERLRQFRELEPSLARIDAQRELVTQTFASVRSSLAGARAAPAGSGGPNAERLQHAVLEINQQTRALEQAVQEVMTLPPPV